eukprot:Trichotokara_eunicae@DN129_c0_g1_i1.p1
MCFVYEKINASNEVFDLTEFLTSSAIQTDKLDHEKLQGVAKVLACIETGNTIPSEISVEVVLRVIEKWATALPVPLVPREFVTDIEGDDSHMLCRAALLSLPIFSRNVFACMMALMRFVYIHSLPEGVEPDDPYVQPLKLALVEWLSRIVTRDTPPREAHLFLEHYFEHDSTSVEGGMHSDGFGWP